MGTPSPCNPPARPHPQDLQRRHRVQRADHPQGRAVPELPGREVPGHRGLLHPAHLLPGRVCQAAGQRLGGWGRPEPPPSRGAGVCCGLLVPLPGCPRPGVCLALPEVGGGASVERMPLSHWSWKRRLPGVTGTGSEEIPPQTHREDGCLPRGPRCRSDSLSVPVSLCLSPSISVSLYLSLPLSLCLSLYLSVSLCISLSVSVSLSLSVSDSLCLCLCLSLCLSLSLSVSLPLSLSVSLYLSLSLSLCLCF